MDYIYRNRAVAFLDVLGFRQKLKEFDKEAKDSITSDVGDKEGIISIKANDFISTFKNAVGKLHKDKYRYYLFSDNICITSINDTYAEDLQDLLLIIAELYFEFAQKGYFLRGGIDYGLFIDEEEIAVGWPLVEAYTLETKYAIYPRILLSDNFINQFQSYNPQGNKVFDFPYADMLVKESCEIKFLNIFLNVFQSDFIDNRADFFQTYNSVIIDNLEKNKNNEAIYTKYQWLANQFNEFIDSFVKELAFGDTNFDPDEEVGFLEFVNQQKISHGN